MADSIHLFDWLPREGLKVLLVLFVSFLVGLEREEHGAAAAQRSFGGVRTFPLIGLMGYAMALLSGAELWPVAAGFVAISAFLALSYWHKLVATKPAGVTSEMSALLTYLIGALVSHEQFWIGMTLGVVCVILLELKTALEALARRVAADDILTFTKFLLLAAVILPIVPNQAFTAYQINPFKTWLVVVAVSAVSYGSYAVRKLTKGGGGMLLTAILGGIYSSTVTTVVLAKTAPRDGRGYMVSGAILIASAAMYVRLAALVALFSNELMRQLAPTFIALAVAAGCVGWLWSRREGPKGAAPAAQGELKNPLEIGAALAFAAFFVAMLIASHLAVQYLGRSGVYTLAAVMGVSDVDPFILGMAQAPPSTAPGLAASAILIAAASNNVAKGIYAYALSPVRTRGKCLLLMLGLAAAGLAPLLW